MIRRFNLKTGRAGRRGEGRQGALVQRHRSRRRWDRVCDGDRRGGQTPDPDVWVVWRITPDGAASIFVQGAPLRQPNGIAIDPKGNIVVANMGTDEILTFSKDAKLLTTEHAAQAGKRRAGDHAGRHEIREQRAERRRVTHPRRQGGADCAEHPQRRVDVLRPGREPAGDPDEREQRAGVSLDQVATEIGGSGIGVRVRWFTVPGWPATPVQR